LFFDPIFAKIEIKKDEKNPLWKGLEKFKNLK